MRMHFVRKSVLYVTWKCARSLEWSPTLIFLKSDVKIDPSRSAFMKERVEVMYEGDDLESILKQVEQIDLAGATFKVIFVKINDLVGGE